MMTATLRRHALGATRDNMQRQLRQHVQLVSLVRWILIVTLRQSARTVRLATTPMLRQLSVLHVQPESTMAILIPALLAVTAVWDISLLEALPHALLVQMEHMTMITTQLHHATTRTWLVLLDIIFRRAITRA